MPNEVDIVVQRFGAVLRGFSAYEIAVQNGFVGTEVQWLASLVGGPGNGGDGSEGWTPVLAVVTDGARRVLQIADWTGGTGTKPAVGQYVAATGLTGTLALAIDVRGAVGADGDDGTDGTDGWTPVLAGVSDGARRVLQVADWTGGTGTKPTTGQYLGATGLTATLALAVDVRGAAGADGDDGWAPVLAVVSDGARRVLQVADWTGGTGTKPPVGQYVGASGLTATLALAVDVRGAAGAAGTSGPIESSGLTSPNPGIPVLETASGAFMQAQLGQLGVRDNGERKELFIPDWATSILAEGLSETDWAVTNAALQTAVRRANGLNPDGTGTRNKRPKTVLLPYGPALCKLAKFTDAAGNPLTAIFYSAGRGARLENLMGVAGNGVSAGFEIDIGAWQHQQAVAKGAFQQIITIDQGRSPRGIGVTSSSSQDDIVTYIEVTDASKYPINSFVSVTTGNVLPYTGTSSSTAKVAEAARVLDVDLVTNRVYLNVRLAYQHMMELGIGPADAAYANTGWLALFDDSVRVEFHNVEFGAGVTTSGRTTARPEELDHGMFGYVKTTITSLTKVGATATANTGQPHLLVTGSRVRIGGIGVGSEVYAGCCAVTVLSPTSYSYTLTTADDWNNAFPQAISAYPDTATGSDLHHVDAFPNLDGSSHSACVELTGVVAPLFNNCYINLPWNQGLRMVSCPGWRVLDLESDGSRNHGTSLDNAVFGSILGYVVGTNNQCCQGVWLGGRIRNSRHGVTSGSSVTTTYVPTTWWQFGQPTYCIIKDVVGIDAYGIMFDGHETDSGWIYINCYDRSARRGPGGGSYNGQSWHLRGRNITLINCGADGASTYGIRVPNVEIPGNPYLYERNNTTTPVFALLRYTVSSIVRMPAVAISAASRAANVLTYGFDAPHGMLVGDPVTIDLLAPSTFNGSFTVASVPSPTTITVNQTGTTETATDQVGTGRVTNGYTIVHAADQFARNTGAHVEQRTMIRLRGATQANFNVSVPLRTYVESGRTGSFILPARDDFNRLFPVAPASVVDTATGTITMTPFSRNTHHIHNFTAKNIHRPHGAAMIVFDQSTIRWRNQVLLTGGFSADGAAAMEVNAGSIVVGDSMTTSRLKFDTGGTTRVIAGRAIFVEGDARVSMAQQFFDASENTHGQVSMCPVNQHGTSSVSIGHLTIRLHRVQRDLVTSCVQNGDGLPGKSFGIGKLTLVDDLPTRPAGFRVLPAGQEANFTWTGGGEQIVMPIRGPKEDIGASETDAAFMRLASNFVAFEARAASFEALVGAGSVGLRMNGSSVFTTPPTFAAGQIDSAAGTLSTAMLPAGSRLAADTVMTGVEPAAGLQLALRGFYV